MLRTVVVVVAVVVVVVVVVVLVLTERALHDGTNANQDARLDLQMILSHTGHSFLVALLPYLIRVWVIPCWI